MRCTFVPRRETHAARGGVAGSLRNVETAGQRAEKARHAAVTPRLAAPPPAGNPLGCRGWWRVSGCPVDNSNINPWRSPNATAHPTSSTPPERMAPPLPTVAVVGMSTDRTVEACERLFDLMALEAVPYRREPAIVTRRPSWQAAYATAAMFTYGCQLDRDDTEEVA